jgi:hypothetical protein
LTVEVNETKVIHARGYTWTSQHQIPAIAGSLLLNIIGPERLGQPERGRIKGETRICISMYKRSAESLGGWDLKGDVRQYFDSIFYKFV